MMVIMIVNLYLLHGIFSKHIVPTFSFHGSSNICVLDAYLTETKAAWETTWREKQKNACESSTGTETFWRCHSEEWLSEQTTREAWPSTHSQGESRSWANNGEIRIIFFYLAWLRNDTPHLVMLCTVVCHILHNLMSIFRVRLCSVKLALLRHASNIILLKVISFCLKWYHWVTMLKYCGWHICVCKTGKKVYKTSNWS